ncbi:hypothetical protein L195_g042570 [Trifolium pratense]|uniref:Uncharacterized protein n=1 Tax=Trifolium pratense TaxID=57577 RepID=A0A2K3M6R7_TRIPR|nr:hypothetical protein L195_g042570 [Trifolium pratense]
MKDHRRDECSKVRNCQGRDREHYKEAWCKKGRKESRKKMIGEETVTAAENGYSGAKCGVADSYVFPVCSSHASSPTS